MKDKIIYVELKSGHNDDGPAWIGKCRSSKSGRTIYFNGKAFGSLGGQGVSGNYYDKATGDEYWISGVKKDQCDRHWAGSGAVMIDKSVVDEYLAFTKLSSLDPKRFRVVQLDHSNVVKHNHEVENQRTSKLSEGIEKER